MLGRVLKQNKLPVYRKNLDDPDPGPESESHEEYQYLNLIHDVLEHGSLEEGRNGFTPAPGDPKWATDGSPTGPRPNSMYFYK